MKKPENLNEVENLNENELASTPNKDSEERVGKDVERRIETPQFPLEDDEIPDSDNPSDDIETIAP